MFINKQTHPVRMANEAARSLSSILLPLVNSDFTVGSRTCEPKIDEQHSPQRWDHPSWTAKCVDTDRRLAQAL